MRITTISVIMVLAVWLVGCAKQDAGTAPADQPPGGSTSKAAPAAPAAKVQTMCPVLGNPISKDVFVDYQGQRIYFCCADCIGKFKSSPETYLKKLADQGVTIEATPAAPSQGSGTKAPELGGSGTKNAGSGTK